DPGQASVGSRPLGIQTVAFTTPGGRSYQMAGSPSWYFRITAFQIGAAPSSPVTFSIDSLSVLPTHTPTVACGVKPIVQLSFQPLVVPVLAATLRSGSVSIVLAPNDGARATSSLMMSAMM